MVVIINTEELNSHLLALSAEDIVLENRFKSKNYETYLFDNIHPFSFNWV
jgi:hypothetical protein